MNWIRDLNSITDLDSILMTDLMDLFRLVLIILYFAKLTFHSHIFKTLTKIRKKNKKIGSFIQIHLFTKTEKVN